MDDKENLTDTTIKQETLSYLAAVSICVSLPLVAALAMFGVVCYGFIIAFCLISEKVMALCTFCEEPKYDGIYLRNTATFSCWQCAHHYGIGPTYFTRDDEKPIKPRIREISFEELPVDIKDLSKS